MVGISFWVLALDTCLTTSRLTVIRYRDSRSIDYQKQYVSLTTGFAYTWRDISITFAINDFNILEDNEQEQALADLTEFGTISFSWKI